MPRSRVQGYRRSVSICRGLIDGIPRVGAVITTLLQRQSVQRRRDQRSREKHRQTEPQYRSLMQSLIAGKFRIVRDILLLESRSASFVRSVCLYYGLRGQRNITDTIANENETHFIIERVNH